MSKPRNRCRDCGLPRDTGRPISKRGLCPECAQMRMASNAIAMATREGPEWDKWVDHWAENMAITEVRQQALHDNGAVTAHPLPSD